MLFGLGMDGCLDYLVHLDAEAASRLCTLEREYFDDVFDFMCSVYSVPNRMNFFLSARELCVDHVFSVHHSAHQETLVMSNVFVRQIVTNMLLPEGCVASKTRE